MKKIPWIIVFISLCSLVSGQRNSDYGVTAGVSSYLGDINPNRLMYSPLPAIGVFYRYNLHSRYSVRTILLFGGLRADDRDFKNDYQQARGESFTGSVGECSFQFEFNFLPYTTQGMFWDFSPYIAAGAGVAVVNSGVMSVEPVIPFAVGFKLNVYKNLGLEAEYGFRKTFYDNFDGFQDLVAPADHALMHNNDWYTFTGIALTWKIYNRLAGCPAYADVDEKKRR
jgi:hypothetical protein